MDGWMDGRINAIVELRQSMVNGQWSMVNHHWSMARTHLFFECLHREKGFEREQCATAPLITVAPF